MTGARYASKQKPNDCMCCGRSSRRASTTGSACAARKSTAEKTIARWTDANVIAGWHYARARLNARYIGVVTDRTRKLITSVLSRGRLERAPSVERIDLTQRRWPWAEDEHIVADDYPDVASRTRRLPGCTASPGT